MFAHRRPGRAGPSRARGIPGDRPGRDDRRPRQVGGRARRRGSGRPRPGRGGPPGARRTARPGPAVTARGPARRTGPGRGGRGHRRDRPRRAPPTTTSAPSSSCSRRPDARSSSPGAGVLRARTSTDLLRFAELLQVPVVASWRRARRHLQRPSAVPRHGRPRRRPPRSVSASRRPTPCSSSAAGSTSRPRPRTRSRPPATRWAHVDIEPARAPGLRTADVTVAADARTFLRAANDRLVGKAVLDAGLVRERQANNAADRADLGGGDDRRCRRRGLGRAGGPSGPGRHDPAPRAARRRDRHDRRRQLRRLGRSRVPVPPARDVPRADVGRDGLRDPGGHRGGPRPSRSSGRGARRRRRHGDDDGRARDRGPRAGPDHRPRLRQRAVRDDPDVAGAARDGGGGRHRARTGRLRRDRAGPRRARASGSSATSMSSRPSDRPSPRTARRSSSWRSIERGSPSIRDLRPAADPLVASRRPRTTTGSGLAHRRARHRGRPTSRSDVRRAPPGAAPIARGP